MSFIIGCNYWASNAGTEMWKNWSEEAVREDFAILSAHGIGTMRVFPNWRDFQPIVPVLGGGASVREYRLEGDRFPKNPYWLDEVMLSRFSRFCDIAAEYDIKLIVGILTGWMSGRTFIPSALFGKNLFTDPVALLFEQRFVKGIVTNFKNKSAIYAWDLGNECNCLYGVDNKYEASNWTGTIANAIRANDNTRPVVSGMHSIGVDAPNVSWTIKGQAEFCDILTTHPYPYWVSYAYKDRTASLRTAMHATCETKYYADLGKRPCLVEEIGTMGPMICDNDTAAAFMRVNLFSNWANGAKGVMWWCANEQTNLTSAPYTQFMCEIELGMIDKDRNPKPVLKETKRVGDVIRGFDFKLPKAEIDAVCILTQSQEQWGAAYMTYCLAKQAGLNIAFAYCDDELPESKNYIMPSICGCEVMPRERYLELKKRVADGANLYISNDNGILAEFEEFCGVRVTDSQEHAESGYIELGEKIEFSRSRRYMLKPIKAEVVAYDNFQNPAVTSNKYGDGQVYYVNFPAETMLLGENNAFDKNRYKIYSEIFKSAAENHVAVSDNKYVGVTLHPISDEEYYVVMINYSDESREVGIVLKDGFETTENLYGDSKILPPFEASVIRIKKKIKKI